MIKAKRNRCEFCGWLLRLDGKHFGNDGITCAKIQSLRESQAVLVEALKELVRCEEQIENQGLQMYAAEKEIELANAIDAARSVLARAEASQ